MPSEDNHRAATTFKFMKKRKQRVTEKGEDNKEEKEGGKEEKE